MENQPSKLDRAVKISIMASALIVALSVAYYLVIFLPEQKELETRKECANKANDKAKNLLKTKADLFNEDTYKKAFEKGLFLKDDYNAIYENCLSENGLKK